MGRNFSELFLQCVEFFEFVEFRIVQDLRNGRCGLVRVLVVIRFDVAIDAIGLGDVRTISAEIVLL
jgi:hypothetical protein